MEPTVFGTKIAFSFVNSGIDFEKLLSRNVQAQLALKSGPAQADDPRLVPEAYRVFCADVVRMLRSYRSVLDQSEKLAAQFGRRLDEQSVFETCEPLLVQQWRPLWRQGNDLARSLAGDREAMEATKRYTELVLTPEFRAGAIWDRSYGKPLGYPGDFQIMNQVYDWQMVGSTVYERLIHRIGLEVAECIRTRMLVVQSLIAETVRAADGGEPARVLSLGSGPAREIELFLASTAAHAGRAQFTLIDQEDDALRYALERTHPHVLRCGGRMQVRGLNISFADVLRNDAWLRQVPPQSLIYSVGLLDYLVDKRARSLVARLYSALAPGGLLVIGNMNETPLSNLWPMEFLTDWTLFYRGEAEMLGWAQGLEAADVWTETEVTERVRLLYIRKP
ncbi:MAG: class I SAM-dependent methyltransferase [Alphaproteobacteria bacterium]|nr:class I SAM-dependent methyltransferase [Alphaproteobacteria bacterium]